MSYPAINLLTVTRDFIRGVTSDGFRVRIDLIADQHGQYRYCIEGDGFSVAGNEPTPDVALRAARLMIEGRCRMMAKRKAA